MIFPDNGYDLEDANWHDTGCELFPSCLDCPRERCIEEEPRGKQKYVFLERLKMIAAMKAEGKSNNEIAEVFHVSLRTIQRAITASRRSELYRRHP